jgi:tetratricopeptide (TPR) repeat protein
MKGKKKYFIAIVALLLTSVYLVHSQTPANMSEYNQLLRNAREMYEKQMYAPALQMFIRLQDSREAEDMQQASQIAFYEASCTYHLDAPNAEALLQNFTNDYPQSIYADEARYMLARHYFGKNEYTAALAAFQAIDAGALQDADKPQYHFKYGYALFVEGRLDEASTQFDKIKDGENSYAPAATYYFAHIAYEQENYNIAAAGFEKLVDNETFAKLVPYYILHIAHQQHNYDKVIAAGEDFIESASAKRLPEIARIIGEAHYFKGQYDKALPFIEKFIATAPALTRSDRYLMGYIYYRNKQYTKAAALFEQIVAGEDSLAQMSHYYLADAWLHTGEKYKAGRAFAQASRMDFLPEIKEDAQYNYAKLMFELKSGPFTDAIDALSQFQKEYPASPHNDEVGQMLMQAYVWSRNYRAAWTSLKTIRNPDAKALAMRQKIAYYLAVENMQNQEYEYAIAYFDSSMQYSAHSPAIAAQATFWKGEAQFNLKNYADAKVLFAEYMLLPSILQTEEYKTAHYNLAYCYYKLGKADEAQVWFRKFTQLYQPAHTGGNTGAGNYQLSIINYQLLSDALCRMGDYSFGQHDYLTAIDNYRKVMDMNSTNVDYATFQCGLCYGLTGNTAQKLVYMDKVIAWLPPSPYSDNAKFEKGRTYTQMQDYPQAISVFNELLRRKESVFFPKTLVELGLVYINSGKTDEAMRYYKQAVEQYPGTTEMRTALVGVRNIYVEQGDVDGYFKYANGLGGIDLSASERDSVLFAAAEHAYFADNQMLAASLLAQYIGEFPQGAFLLDANFYLADNYLRMNKDSAAIPYYEAVLRFPKNDYTENSLDALSAIAFNLEQYDKASEFYGKLSETASNNALLVKAHRGKALSTYMRRNYAEAIEAASKLLSTSDLTDALKQEMHYVRAKSYEQTSDSLGSAIADFAAIAVNVKSKEGAEAAYKTIEYEFGQGNLDKVESDVIRFSKSGSPHEYWIARAFILLGDVYVQRGDAFQAKATYESIVDGYSNDADGIKDAVRERISQLLATEALKDKAASESRFEVEVKN